MPEAFLDFLGERLWRKIRWYFSKESKEKRNPLLLSVRRFTFYVR